VKKSFEEVIALVREEEREMEWELDTIKPEKRTVYICESCGEEYETEKVAKLCERVCRLEEKL